MSSMTSAHPVPPSAHRTLLLLAAVFILPLVVGSGLFWSGWRPETFTHHGELLQPPRVLPENGLRHIDGQSFPTSDLRGKWLLLLPANGSCDSTCQQTLQQMQQVHIALNKEQKRLQRVFLQDSRAKTVNESSLQGVQNLFPDLLVATVNDTAASDEWHKLMEGHGKEIFVVDPLGNMIMRYSEPIDMRGVLKDLERLLKYSWIN